MNELAPLPPPPSSSALALPALVASADEAARLRFLEFFAVTIRNPHTRRAYMRAAGEFLAWCEARGVASLAGVQPLHVAAWIEAQGGELAPPSVKQQLAGVRSLFDWLVMGQVVPANPAASVRGPAYSQRRGKTPVLVPDEARHLLDTIDVATHAGLRDRALIGLMVYSFARIGAARRRALAPAAVVTARAGSGAGARAVTGGARARGPVAARAVSAVARALGAFAFGARSLGAEARRGFTRRLGRGGRNALGAGRAGRAHRGAARRERVRRGLLRGARVELERAGLFVGGHGGIIPDHDPAGHAARQSVGASSAPERSACKSSTRSPPYSTRIQPFSDNVASASFTRWRDRPTR